MATTAPSIAAQTMVLGTLTPLVADRLRAAGYALQHVRSVREAAGLAVVDLPHAIFLAGTTDEVMSAAETLRTTSSVGPAVPLIGVVEGVSRARGVSLFAAGIWDLLDESGIDHLLPRLANYCQVRHQVERARRDGLVNQVTGLYNLRGIAQRARELVAEAFRGRASLSCLALAPRVTSGSRDAPAIARAGGAIARRLPELLRRSDVSGQDRIDRFVVLAPYTDPPGAERLAERLAQRLQPSTVDEDPQYAICVGFQTVANLHEHPMDPMTLVAQATRALRHVLQEPVARISPFGLASA